MDKRGVWASAIALMMGVLLAPTGVRGQWEGQYDASSNIFPEFTSTPWTYYNNDTAHFQRGFVNNNLWVNTMPPGDPYRAQGWERTTGSFNFATGFAMEASLRMVQATNGYAEWGGAQVSARSATGYNLFIEVDPGLVNLGSIFNFVSYPMDTTDAFHTYRAEALNNQGKLYVDGVLRLQMPLVADNPIPDVWFGDQGWEGGETYFQYVRYGSVVTTPEPATASLLAGGAFLTLMRRRRVGQQDKVVRPTKIRDSRPLCALAEHILCQPCTPPADPGPPPFR